MAKLLYRLGRWSFLHKWKVIVAWLLLLAAVGGAAALLMKPMTSEFSIKGTPSIDATYKTMDLFPEGGNPANSPSVNVVFKAPDGQKLSDPANREAIDATISYLEDNLEMGDTTRFGNPLEVSPRLQDQVIHQFTDMGLPEASARADADNLAMVNDDETIAYTTFNFDAESPYSVEQADKDTVTEAMNIARDRGLTVEGNGAGFGDEIAVNSTSEIIGLGVAFIVLIFTFGSLVASGMPLVSAVIGVGLGALGMFIATHWIELNNMTPVLAIMIGLAVGIDYALFILSRYRAERRRMDGPDAAGMAVGTAGSSVVFAGATVFTALFALLIARIGFLTAMGLAAAGTVAIAVLVSLTLIPAMLGLLGDKAFNGRIPGVAGNPTRKGKRRRGPTMGNRWVRLVQKVPGLAMALVVLSLGAMTAPVLHMELALPADTTSNPDTTQRKAAEDALRRSEEEFRTLAEALPEAVSQGFVELLDQVFATGEPFVANGVRFEVQPTPGGPLRERFLDFVYQPIRDASGVITGIFVEGADVTERTLAAAALRDSETRYKALLNTTDIGFCIIQMKFDEADRPVDYRIVEGNAAYERMTGLHGSTGK